MTDDQFTRNEPATTGWDGQSVIAVSFDEDRSAYHALTPLKELDSQRRVVVEEAVVVRGEDGQAPCPARSRPAAPRCWPWSSSRAPRSSRRPCPQSAARCSGAPWPWSRPRSPSQRRARRKAKREARTELLRSRHEHNKAAVNAKLEELKVKVHHAQGASAVSA